MPLLDQIQENPNNPAPLINLADLQKTVTLERVVSRETLSFHQLQGRGIYTRNDLLKLISSYIKITCDNTWNLTNPLTAGQSITIAAQLLERADFTIEDVVCIMKMASRGDFGELYNRLDVGVFNEWLSLYLDQRIDALENQYQKEKSERVIPGERSCGTTDMGWINQMAHSHDQ